MTSIRKARRHLLRWERYDAKTEGWYFVHSPGHERARTVWRYAKARLHPTACRCSLCIGIAIDREAEEERRFWAETPEVWLGGPAGEAALISDVGDGHG